MFSFLKHFFQTRLRRQEKQFRFKDSSRTKKRLRKIFFILIIIFFAFLLFCSITIAGFYFYFSKDLPDPDKITERHISQTTKIFDRTGQTLLYEIHGQEKRTLVDLKDIPKNLVWTTIVAEDKYFYQHKGFDFKRVIAALYFDLVHRGKFQGASTITQQLVKNTIVGKEKTYLRKIKELILAFQIERNFSKDEILKMYLNEIPYGSYLYGVEAASQALFKKPVSQITLAEAALIAALPKAPTYYSPYGSHLDDLHKRKEMILDRLVELNYAKKEDVEKAKEEKIKIYPLQEKIIAPHFIMYVKEILEEKYGQKMIEEGGLNVFTTLDLGKQQIAEEAIKKYGEINEKKYGAKNAALVAIDPKKGEILSMVGSRDFFDIENDGNVNVALSLRQPGSSFKPYAYAVAFQKGLNPNTVLFDLITNFGPGGNNKDYIPHDYDNKTRGPVNLRKALAGSLNIPAVKVLYIAGINEVIDLAEKMGITSLQDRSRFGLALVLGGGEVKLLEHTAAYGVFARDGVKHKLTSILKIEKQGKIIEENKEEAGEKILDENVASMINDVLSDNEARSFIFGARSSMVLSRPAGAKTGTTQDSRDAWTIGYTPSLVCGVWVGNNDNSSMKWGGVQLAGPIWHQFMEEALKGTEVEKFTPLKISQTGKAVLDGKEFLEETKKICRDSGKLATEFCPESHLEEKNYKEAHTILRYIDKKNPLGPAPVSPEKDPQYWHWEEPIKAWLQEQGFLSEDAPKEYCDLHKQENKPKISILLPKDKETISENVFKIEIEAIALLGIEKVEFYLDDKLIGAAQTSPFVISFSNIKANENVYFLNGWHTLLVRAFDKIGNENQEKIEINFKMDITPPEVSMVFPSQDMIFNATSSTSSLIILKAKTEDASGIESIEFYAKNNSLNTLSQLIGKAVLPVEKNNYQISWPLPLQKGIYSLYAWAYDVKGNRGESEDVLVEIK